MRLATSFITSDLNYLINCIRIVADPQDWISGGWGKLPIPRSSSSIRESHEIESPSQMGGLEKVSWHLELPLALILAAGFVSKGVQNLSLKRSLERG